MLHIMKNLHKKMDSKQRENQFHQDILETENKYFDLTTDLLGKTEQQKDSYLIMKYDDMHEIEILIAVV